MKIVLIGNVAHLYWTFYRSVTDNRIEHTRIQCVMDMCLDEQPNTCKALFGVFSDALSHDSHSIMTN
jgi:hypothetical protein